jgi:predicted TIM-barrel fold metal-dependent hydrolase
MRAKTDRGRPAGHKVLHCFTELREPEVVVREGRGERTVAMARAGDGLFVADIADAGADVELSVRDRRDGREDRPPGAQTWWLPGELHEAWLDHGTVFDVDPRRISIELIDAHTHPFRGKVDGKFVADAGPLVRSPSQGIGMALTMVTGSLAEQRALLEPLVRANPWLVPLVWVKPATDSVSEVASMLDAGFRGLKFHPTIDGYNADMRAMDGFLELARSRRLPVQIHSATDDPSLPSRIIDLARRFPRVPVVMVHTELGALSKTAVLAQIREVPNIYAETSWTNPESILEAMATLDSSRTLFGSDATVDGYEHFTKKSIANPKGEYVYSIPEVIARVREQADPAAFRNWSKLNAIRLYGLRFRTLYP